jgi:hypothetical protein
MKKKNNKLTDTHKEISLYNKIARTCFKKGEYELSLIHNKNTYKLIQSNSILNISYTIDALMNIAHCHALIGNIKSSIIDIIDARELEKANQF